MTEPDYKALYEGLCEVVSHMDEACEMCLHRGKECFAGCETNNYGCDRCKTPCLVDLCEQDGKGQFRWRGEDEP